MMEMPTITGSAEIIDLARAVTRPADGIMSRTIFQDSQIKAIVFGFGSGQELSEHTASKPAIMHFLDGEADITVDGQASRARPGTWVHMAAGVSHSIVADTPTTMLLLLLGSGR